MPSAKIESLFRRFEVRYQRAWSSLMPTPETQALALQEWDLILAEVSATGIERALKRCVAEFRPFRRNRRSFWL